MRLPWISRKRLTVLRRTHKRQIAALELERDEMRVKLSAEFEVQREGLEKHALGRVQEMQRRLDASELERTDLQLKLLRVGFGINPFHELVAAEHDARNSVLPDASAPEPPSFSIRPGMSDQEIQGTFVREGQELYGQNLRAIKQHVEKRQREYYSGGRKRQEPIVSPEEMARARAIAADLQAALDEGRAAAAKETQE